MIIAETERLVLRTLREDDIDHLMLIWGNDEVMQYAGGAGTKDMEIKSLRFYRNLFAEKRYSPFAVILKHEHQFVGVCGFNPPHQDGPVELMYHFAKAHWHKGYATEAAQASIIYAKSMLNLDRITAYFDPENTKSENVLIKLGFVYKGIEWHHGSQKKEPFYELVL